jgi:hypothetical protein
MGTRSTKGLQRSKTISYTANNHDSTFIRSSVATVCGWFPAAVSAVQVKEKQDEQAKNQVPIYFIFEVLSPSKRNYTELEKVLYAILMASRKLRHYFQSYHIIVPLSQPHKDIIRNREATGRVGKWAA